MTEPKTKQASKTSRKKTPKTSSTSTLPASGKVEDEGYGNPANECMKCGGLGANPGTGQCKKCDDLDEKRDKKMNKMPDREPSIDKAVKSVEKGETVTKSNDNVLKQRDASRKTRELAIKMFGVEPVDARADIKKRGVIRSYTHSMIAVIDFLKYSTVASGLLLKSIEQNPDLTVVLSNEQSSALLNFAKHKMIDLGKFAFSYADIHNALKILANKLGRYTVHLFTGVEKVDDADVKVAAIVIQNPNLESVCISNLSDDAIIEKPVDIETLCDEYHERQAEKRKQSIEKYYGGKGVESPEDLLGRWSDFEN